MKRLLLALVVLGSLMFSSCSLNQMIKASKEQQLTVTPNPLEVHADTVDFEMSALLPAKMLKKGKVYSLETYYTYGNSEIALEGVEFAADEYPNADTEQPRETKEFSFPYEEGMDQNGMLQIQGVATNPKNGKSKETERMDVAPGIIRTSTLVQNSYYPAYADHGYNNQEELLPFRINFYFDQGKSYLRSSLATDGETNRSKQRRLEGFIADKNVTRTVTITGTHSPEGPERINTALSNDRAKVIEDFYGRQMDKYDYKGMADSVRFILKPVVRDWSDFKDTLASYPGISSEEKSEYLNIINGPGTFEEQEDQLHELSTYNKVFKDLYPPLRSAKTEVLMVKDKKSDAEILVLGQQIANGETDPDTLSYEELMYAGTLTPSLDEKEAIYLAATKKGSEWNAHNNLAAVYVAQAMENPSEASSLAENAVTQAEISLKAQENAEAYVNLASAYLLQGNREAASDAIKSATDMNLSGDLSRGANGVLGAVLVSEASYDRAVNALSSSQDTPDNLFNRGLAQLLNRDFQNAIASFEECLEADSEYALASYGAAVASARLANLDQVIEHLGDAVQKDPSLKEKALNDLEFTSYAANEGFRAALQ